MSAEVSAGGVVINQDGDILVVNQDGTVWSLPKGHVNPGETARVAAEREIKEESGVSRLRYIKNLGSYQRYQVGKGGKGEHKDRLKTITLFLYTTDQLDLRPEDPRNPEARWVAPTDVVTMLTIPKDKAYFASILPDVLQFLAESK